MRLEALGVFSREGEARLVEFGPGLNVVTGWSGTGKSSLLDIAEYCLGRRHPTYAAGVLTQAVGWFGAQVEHGGARLVIVRPAPTHGSATGQSAAIVHGGRLSTVDVAALPLNADVDSVRSELTQLLQVGPNEIRASGLIRPRLEATASQALLFCFQAQDELASSGHLFHRADEEPIREVIRDTLPFFLGAVDVDTAALAHDLRQRGRDLRRATLRLEQAQQAALAAPVRARTLHGEAVAVGLVSPDSEADILDQLRGVADLLLPAESRTGSSALTEPLRIRQLEIIREIAGLEHRLTVILANSRNRRDFGLELGEQRHRLSAIGVAAPATGDQAASCPVCGSHLSAPDASVAAMTAALTEIDGQLEAVRVLEPVADTARREIERGIGELRAELWAVDAELRAVTEADAQLSLAGDADRDRAFLSGRIAEFLTTLPPTDDAIGRLQAEQAAIAAEVERLESTLDREALRERTESLLRVVSQDLSLWARDLDLGYAEASVQISLDSLTVVADTREGPVPLYRMGSAANIIGYHVAAHLALHKWFIEKARPVPAFLMLDQPSQAFFPDEVRSESDEFLADDDRERVVSLYSLLQSVVQSLDGRLQVIVVDHANLDLDWFQAAIVENWRRGHALVPRSWITSPETDQGTFPELGP